MDSRVPTILGASMASIICTGQYAAIQLKTVHSEEILKLDELATQTAEGNGGYGNFLLQMWRKVFTKITRCDETYVLKKDKIPNA
jgi:hypothetical protein